LVEMSQTRKSSPLWVPIAASDGEGICTAIYPLMTDQRDSGYYSRDGKLVAFALTPGYETYRGLGWLGCIESEMGEE
jgi:hypothetical protein